jgi:hypothetical protein
MSVFHFTWTLAPFEVSYHYFEFNKGNSLVATATPDTNTNLDCFLLDDDGKILDQDEGPENSCHIVFISPNKGRYHIQVLNMGKNSTKYTLQASVYKK